MPSYQTTTTKGHAGKAKAKHSVGGFIHNLASDAHDALVGIVEAPYYLTKAGYHDIQHGNTAESGAMLKAIGQNYKHYYYDPISRGNFGQFGENLYQHPGQPVLDALTLLDGAGAVAGALGKASEVGRVGALAGDVGAGGRIAGLRRISHSDYKSLNATERASATKAKNGTYLVPAKHDIVNRVGKVSASRDVVRNPVIRGRKALVERALQGADRTDSKFGALTNGYFGPDRRGARLTSTVAKRVERAKRQAAALEATHAVSMLDKDAKHALFYRLQGFNNEARYGKLLAHRLDETAHSVRGPREKLAVKHDVERLTKPAVHDQIVNPSPALQEAEAKLLDVSDVTQADRASRGHLADSRARAEMPLRTVGVEPLPQERLAVVSHSQHRVPRSERRSKTAGVKSQGVLGSDRTATGHAFQHAMYDADPLQVVKSQLDELSLKKNHHDLQYMMAISRPYDAADESIRHGLRDGTLKALRVDSKPLKQLHEIAAFGQNTIVPLVKDANPAAVADYEQTYALLREWNDEAAKAGAEGIVVPTDTWNDLTKQIESADGLYKKLLKTPTRLWRDLTLSLKGSFYVNNFLGNLLLGLVAHPVKFIPNLLTHGTGLTKLGKRIDKADPQLVRSGQANTLAKLSEDDMASSSKLNPLNNVSRFADFIAHQGAKGTENNFRRASAAIEFKSAARQLMHNDGISHGEAMDALFNDRHAVDALTQKVYGDLLDYSRLSPAEKDYILPFLPFWNFTRSIAGKTITLTLDEPWKIQVLKAMSQSALAENKDGVFANIKGDLPPYLSGLMQVGPTVNGVTPVYSTYAANPFSSVADTVDQVGSLVGGAKTDTQSPLAQVNPYIKSGIEALVGQDVFLGKKLTGSRGEIYLSQLANSFPQLASYQRARYPGASPFIERTPQQALLQYAGLPVGSFNEKNANSDLAINRYFATKDAAAAAKADAKKHARDRGRYLGLAH